MTAQIYDFTAFLKTRFALATKQTGLFNVSIEKENIRTGMKLLSKIFPEITGLESDAAAFLSFSDFKDASNSENKMVTYVGMLLVRDKTLRVGVIEGTQNTSPAFSITSAKPNTTCDQLVLPMGWGGQGPYITVSDYVVITEPVLLKHLQRLSEDMQSPKFEPLRNKIARAMGGEMSFRNNGNIQIPTITINENYGCFQEARLR